jgi:hypothetical protein
MALNISNENIGILGGTYKLDDATFDLIKADFDAAKGLGVTLLDNTTVGFGVAGGSPLFGIIEVAEGRGTVSVTIAGVREGIPTGATAPALGETGLGVDDTGKIVKLAAGKRGTVSAVNAASGSDPATVDVVLPL